MNEIELKNCPFCGGKKNYLHWDDELFSYFIKCTKCFVAVVHLDEEHLVELWNNTKMENRHVKNKT